MTVQASAAAPTVEGQERRHMTKGMLAVTLDPHSSARLRAIELQDQRARERAAARWQEQTRMSRAELVASLEQAHCPGRGDYDELFRLAAKMLRDGAETAWYASVGASLMLGDKRPDAARRATLQVFGEVRVS